MTILRLDWESKSEVDLKVVGLDVYSAHPSTRILMGAYSLVESSADIGNVIHWDATENSRIPAELKEAILDPNVEKRAFNAQFERVMANRVLGLVTPYEAWKCTMVLAYMQSFTGGLGDIGAQMGLSGDRAKDAEGRRLIMQFCKPQRITKNQPHRWRDSSTDPIDWEKFCGYNCQDIVAEGNIDRLLSQFPVPDSEWELYAIDQLINDRGIPMDMEFVHNAIWMAAQRKRELVAEMKEMTGLANPNSTAQLLPFLKARGYPFNDLKKDTVKKVLRDNKAAAADGEEFLLPLAVNTLKKRQQASRTSVAKYDAIKRSRGRGARFRFAFQMHGASRTGRWAGRRIQAQNLPRTPKEIEEDIKLTITTDLIRRGDYEGLALMMGEPMNALVGCIRSAIRAPDGYEFVVADLSSIETCVIAWLACCQRLLDVIRSGKDAYKDFATILFNKPYDEVTKSERGDAKPAVLGSGYRLGGGEIRDGKKTGLWGYAENMGVDMTEDMAHKATKLFRENYFEIPELWYALERAVERCIRTGTPQTCGPLKFLMKGPYMLVRLPSGRHLYYYKPKIIKKVPPWGGEPKKNFSYMGQDQKTGKWVRIVSHGGKLVENFVQAIARDVLKAGLIRAHRFGFNIVLHVHDEIAALRKLFDKKFTLEALMHCMTDTIRWCPDLPLGAAGWTGPYYKKD